MPRLTLYNFWRSSSSHRVRLALSLKGLPYEYVAVDLGREEHASPGHLSRSPTGFVPCLVVDDVPYIESVAIVELLEELFPAPALYPRTAHDRARVRALVEIVNSGTQPLHNRSVERRVTELTRSAETGSRWNRHFIERGLHSLEQALDANAREGVRGPYAYGDAPTVADVFLVPQVVAAKRFGVAVDAHPRVQAAFEAALRLDAVQKEDPERQVDANPRRTKQDRAY